MLTAYGEAAYDHAMSTLGPLDVDRTFVRAMNDGDVETIMSLYREETIFVQEPGSDPARGLATLREITERFLAYNPTLTVQLKQFVQAGDIALVSVRWSLAGTDADGAAVLIEGTDANVLRQTASGTWFTLIDNPFHEEYLDL